MVNKRILVSLLILSSCFFVFAQNSEKQPVPDGYMNVKLGMNLEDTKNALLENSNFGYHGDRDVSFLPGQNRQLIETDANYGHGSNYLERCFFQFSNDSLYIITINFNPEKIDYYSIFKTLVEKYGSPDSLDPQSATWKSDEVTMSLEKPLSIKYIDNETFESLQNYSNVPPSGTEITQEMFLDSL